MSGNNLILDSNVLIYLSKGQKGIFEIIEQYSNIYISVITKMEVLGFPFKNDEERLFIEKIITTFEIIHTNDEITDCTIHYRKKKKIKIPDAIILATAKVKKANILTANSSDFKGIDSTVKILHLSL
ncbi:MAG: type II toxin-antitoxin system VapC family toxin [Bacteroidia bacterium]|nr:type II toxin-antitoxin system VapC family toxin [Bacteroidia bacterium]